MKITEMELRDKVEFIGKATERLKRKSLRNGEILWLFSFLAEHDDTVILYFISLYAEPLRKPSLPGFETFWEKVQEEEMKERELYD